MQVIISKFLTNLWSLSAVIFLFLSSFAMAEDKELIVSGSSSVSSYIMFGNIETLQEKSGIPFQSITSSSGRGVLDVASKKSDIGMISSGLPGIIEKLNAEGHELTLEDFNLHPLNQEQIVFLVHENNPVEELSREQVVGILKGEITDWAAFGHDELGPIKLVTEHKTGGMYALASKKLIDGDDFGGDHLMMQNGHQVGLVLGQMKNGFGFTSNASKPQHRMNTKIIKTPDLSLMQELSYVTRAEENRKEVFDLIDTFIVFDRERQDTGE